MSFGIGVGDIALIIRTSWRLYKACKESSEDFARLSTELMSLHAVLGETRDFLAENTDRLDASRRNRLEILTAGCNSVLTDLDALVTRYDSLGTQAQRAWDRVRFGLTDLADVRGRLVSNTTLLNAFNTAMINSSTARIEKKLNKFMAEVQAGLREGSVITTTDDVIHTIESSPDVWAQLRRELEDVGISAAIVEQNHEYILAWMKGALADGALDELINHNHETELSKPAPAPPPSDSGYGSLSGASTGPGQGPRGSVSSVATSVMSPGTAAIQSLTAANIAFEEELRRQRAEWVPGAGLELSDSPSGGAGASGAGLGDERLVSSLRALQIRRRRVTDPVGLVKKLFKKETAIIEAASDGDAEAVAKLIGLGMDVNVRDRWGWSALSMCGYGGHKAIARMLLDHGADLDNVDVDGDTPCTLAAQRGHAELCILFDEERAARDLRVREMDSEVPRKVEV
ncbi:hypothetical protein B0T17DRAFT_530160 [Bombardia bombarda]|uniref:Uncharacterized protein n=1 Tax=Bombardia bombarda TaxID=252184 RepID=A0AA39XBY3_9PEZI|nr:hypothetical protein B0T17DRAFT_530160 [Bombardia bombarda]